MAAEETDKSNQFLLSNTVPLVTLTPTTKLILQSPSGREAVIDFGGDKVIYSGDLPLDESAKIFMEAVLTVFKNTRCKEGTP